MGFSPQNMPTPSFRAYSLLLPGLVRGDEVKLHDAAALEADATCPLTLEAIADGDAEEHLTQFLARHLTGPQAQDEMREALKRPLPVAAQVVRCGHQFCALPFLMHVLGSRFSCPVCRAGSAREVNLDTGCARLPAPLWRVLGDAARTMRRETQREREEEDRQVVWQELNVDIRALSIAELVADVLTFVVAFQVCVRGVVLRFCFCVVLALFCCFCPSCSVKLAACPRCRSGPRRASTSASSSCGTSRTRCLPTTSPTTRPW